MTQLTVKENNAIAALPVQIQPIVAARFGKPIVSYSKAGLAIEIKNMLLRVYFEKGLNIDEKDSVLSQQREILLEDFRAKKYENISMELIRLFVSNGVRGDYGTFKGQLNTVNIENIHYWVKKGLESEDYKRSVTEFNRKLDEEIKTSKTPVVYTKEHLATLSVNAFLEYKESGKLPIPIAAAVFYNTIKEALKVETLIDKLDWKNILNDAKSQYTQAQKEMVRKSERKTLKIDYTLATEGKPGNSQFEAWIKRTALKYYFDTLISKGEDLKL